MLPSAETVRATGWLPTVTLRTDVGLTRLRILTVLLPELATTAVVVPE